MSNMLSVGSDEQALNMIKSVIHQFAPDIRNYLQQKLSEGTPPMQLIQWLRELQRQKAREEQSRQQQQQHPGGGMQQLQQPPQQQQHQPQLPPPQLVNQFNNNVPHSPSGPNPNHQYPPPQGLDPSFRQQQQPQQSGFDSETAARQMAALNAANRVKRGTSQQPPFPPGPSVSRPGTSSGQPLQQPNNAFVQSQQQVQLQPPFQQGNAPPAPTPAPQRPGPRQHFLKMLNDIMIQSGNPLPPNLTGIPNPMFDPSKSRFSSIDIPSEGCIRIAGKLVDLHDLFMTVLQRFGGSAKISQTKQWGAVSMHFALPEMVSVPNNPNPISIATMLPQYYAVILGVLEEWYLKQQQQKAFAARQQQIMAEANAGVGVPSQGMPPRAGGPSGPAPPVGGVPGAPGAPGLIGAGVPGENPTAFGADAMAGQKRKMLHETSPEKRPRYEGTMTNVAMRPPTPPPMPTEARNDILPLEPLLPSDQKRLKIEYVPITRPLDTYGGRRLDAIEQQLSKVAEKRVIRHFDELGPVEIDGLTLSLRSGLSSEISYALITLTMLSTMNISGKGLQLERCDDLLDALMDLMEDQAFEREEEDEDEDVEDTKPRKVWTRPQLVKQMDEDTTISSKAKARDSPTQPHGPGQEPSVIILSILNVLRNLSLFEENQKYMPRNPRLLDVLARISDVGIDGGLYRPVSIAINLADLVRIHGEIISIVATISHKISLGSQQRRTARRLYSLLISPLVDAENIVKPVHEGPSDPTLPVPHVDMALDAFSGLAQHDSNREVLAKVIPHDELKLHFESLVHMLPLTEADFLVTVGSSIVMEAWMGYLERLVQCVYSIVFLSPPSLKQTLRKMPGLGFVFFRMIRFYLSGIRPTDRATFAAPMFDKNSYSVMARRAFETLSLLDLGENSFDPIPATPLAFAPPPVVAASADNGGGGGGREPRGMLSSHFSEVLTTLLAKEGMDQVVFTELESLVRLVPAVK